MKKLVQGLLIILFIYLLNNFSLLGGTNYPSLRIKIELIIILLILYLIQNKGYIVQNKVNYYLQK